MTRLPDWRARLNRYVADSARQEFRLGRMDCALFAAGAVEAMTGEDPARDLRGRYRRVADGERLLGDLAEVEDLNGRPALGVVQGERVYVRMPRALGTIPLLSARRAFKV